MKDITCIAGASIKFAWQKEGGFTCAVIVVLNILQIVRQEYSNGAKNSRSLYISPEFKFSLLEIKERLPQLFRGEKLPEPIRLADQFASRRLPGNEVIQL